MSKSYKIPTSIHWLWNTVEAKVNTDLMRYLKLSRQHPPYLCLLHDTKGCNFLLSVEELGHRKELDSFSYQTPKPEKELFGSYHAQMFVVQPSEGQASPIIRRLDIESFVPYQDISQIVAGIGAGDSLGKFHFWGKAKQVVASTDGRSTRCNAAN